MPFSPPDVAPVAAPPGLPVPVPFSAGSVIGRSFGVWFRNFLPFSIVTLVVHVPVLVLAGMAPPSAGAAWQFADQLLTGLAGLVATGALAYGVLTSLRGSRATIGTLFSTGFRKAGWVFVTSFGVGLWVLLGTVLLIIPGVIMYCALYVAVPAVVLEPDSTATEALARSRELTMGHRWSVFAVVLVLWLTTFLAAAIAGVLLPAVASAAPHPIPSLVATVTLVLVSSFGACASAVAYHDLRVAKEGVATADLVKVFE